MKTSIFTISLDFELLWGVRDHRTIKSYGSNILGAREVIPRMLECFSKYQVNATWATVGFLFYSTKKELLEELPSIKPSYHKKHLSPYTFVDLGIDEKADPYHFGASLIDLINRYPGQEIATHTYSHYYCLEEGQTAEQFDADMQKAVAIGNKKGFALKSIVFPRNQFNAQYLEICKKYGVTVYRGNENSWLYEPLNREQETRLRRLIRLADTYINLTGHHVYSFDELKSTNDLFNIPASRFLRPYNPRLSFLEGLKLKRIKSAMTVAAQQGKLFHLWWHPHNFGKDIGENMEQLEEILTHYNWLHHQYQMKSMSMAEVADMIKGKS